MLSTHVLKSKQLLQLLDMNSLTGEAIDLPMHLQLSPPNSLHPRFTYKELISSKGQATMFTKTKVQI